MENTIIIHRKIKSETLRIEKLKKYIGRNAEVVIHIEEENETNKNSAAGFLHRYAETTAVAKEKLAWEMAVKTKHAHC